MDASEAHARGREFARLLMAQLAVEPDADYQPAIQSAMNALVLELVVTGLASEDRRGLIDQYEAGFSQGLREAHFDIVAAASGLSGTA